MSRESNQKPQLPRSDRYRVSLKVAWDDGESYFTGPVLNISESGLYIETTMPATIGQEITITPLIDDVDTPFELRGKVVRAKDFLGDNPDASGMGIQLSPLNPNDLDDLRRLLARFRV